MSTEKRSLAEEQASAARGQRSKASLSLLHSYSEQRVPGYAQPEKPFKLFAVFQLQNPGLR